MDHTPEETVLKEVIGLVPAGGQAKRIGPLPCSKELYPIGFRVVEGEEGRRPKTACHYILEKMRGAGITQIYIVLREGKWDIPAYLRDGSMLGVHIAYLIVQLPFGVPYTLDQAYPFVQDRVVAFGFPDIIFNAESSFKQLIDRQKASNADIVLGLFPTDRPEKEEMVDVDKYGRVKEIIIKPSRTSLHYTWGIAVWSPRFTRFLHDYVIARKSSADRNPELSITEVLQAAIEMNMNAEACPVSDHGYLDIGTPEDLLKAVRYFAVP